MLSRWRKQVRDGELLGRPPPLNASSIAELQRLCEVEQQFKRLQMEHDMHSNHALENGRSQASLLARAVQRERWAAKCRQWTLSKRIRTSAAPLSYVAGFAVGYWPLLCSIGGALLTKGTR